MSNTQQTSTNQHSGEIVIAKFHYTAQDNHELSINKNERLLLLDDSCLWWKVKRIDSDENGYIPSNFARREKRSLLDKIISKRVQKKSNQVPGQTQERIISLALVKFSYEAGSDDEISLSKGFWVHVLDKKNDGWWLVQYEKQKGWFPSNYLIEKNNDTFNSLSLLNQLKYQYSSSSSTNGLSSSSSANSNIVECDPSQNVSSNRHNSHPAQINTDDYEFTIKSSKLAHSDGKLDACLSLSSSGQKNSSWSGLDSKMAGLSSPDFDDSQTNNIVDSFLNMTIENQRQPVYFYGSISREQAENNLKSDGIERGDFLIRNSERKFGHYSLSIRADENTIRHFKIESIENGRTLLIGKRSFNSFDELIEHYKTHPVYDAEPLSKLYLNKPLMKAWNF